MSRSTLFSSGIVPAVIIAVTLAGIVPAGIGAGLASAQANGPTRIDSCRTIDQPGSYLVTSRLQAPDGQNCLMINSSDVTLDGGGHIVHGNGSAVGVLVSGASGATENVTVRNVYAAYWSYAIEFQRTSGGTVENVTGFGSGDGVTVIGSTDVNVTNASAYQNNIGIHVTRSQGTTVRNSTAKNNQWGVHFERGATNNTVADTVSRDNFKWDVYSKDDSTRNRVERVTTRSGTFSFTPTNVALRGIASPPSPPDGRADIGAYVETAPTNGQSSFGFLRANYRGGGANNGESSLSMWRADNGSWQAVPSSSVNTNANTVSTGRLTSFGVYAPLADSGTNVTGATTTERESAGKPGPISFRQGGTCYPVQPLGNGTTSGSDFYDYQTAYSDPNGSSTPFTANGPITDLERANTSQVFLYNGSDGLSLVFLHDGAANNSESGGTVTADVTGLPANGNWTTLDDTYPRNDDVIVTRPGRAHFEWVWNFGSRADGGVFVGLGQPGWDAITVEAMFNERSVRYPFAEWTGPPEANHVDSWIARSGNGSTYRLDMTQPLTIARGSCSATAPTTQAASRGNGTRSSMQTTGTSAQSTGTGTDGQSTGAQATSTGTGSGSGSGSGSESAGATSTTTGTAGPGFGLLAGVVALFGASLLVTRRRND